MELTLWKLPHGFYITEVKSWNVHHGSYLVEVTPWKLPQVRPWQLRSLTYTMEVK